MILSQKMGNLLVFFSEVTGVSQFSVCKCSPCLTLSFLIFPLHSVQLNALSVTLGTAQICAPLSIADGSFV